MYCIKQLPEDFIVEEIASFTMSEQGHFEVYSVTKRNLTTLQIVQSISRMLKTPVKYIGFCGSKDKKAVTTQFISIKGPISSQSKQKILQHNETHYSHKRDSWFTLEFRGYRRDPLSLGDHSSNKFTITVRNLNDQESNALLKLKNKKEWNFINYFGEQRFGSKNEVIGVSLLKKDYKTAIKTILESQSDTEALVKHLKNHPNDFTGAIKLLPQKLITILVHSYQSHIWNQLAEKFSNDSIPIVGWDTTFEDKQIEKATLDLLAKDKLTLRDFIFRDLKLSLTGGLRQRTTSANQVTLEFTDDTINQGMKAIIFKFTLEKGCYATEFIHQTLKTINT